MAPLLFVVLLSALHLCLAESSPSSDFNCSSSVEHDMSYITTIDLPQVYESLLNCPDTLSLRLSLFTYGRNFEAEPVNFKFLAGNQFPRLRELSLDGYDFGDIRPFREQARWDQAKTIMKQMLLKNAEANYLPPSQTVYIPGANLEDWKANMDWTALRSLKLFNVDNIFFWKMKGYLPALKELAVGNNQGRSNASDYMTDFITALNPLSNLSTHGYTSSVNWSQVLERHGSSLERLEIQDWNTWKPENSKTMLSTAQVEEISRLCPLLSELSVNVKMDAEISHEFSDVLASFRNLTKLTIRLRGNQPSHDLGMMNQSYDLSNNVNPLNEEKEADLPFISAQKVLQIFQNIRLGKQGVELQQLKVYFDNYDIKLSRSEFDWEIDLSSMASKHTCSVFNNEGNRKMEGEAWCQCEGMCRKAGIWFPLINHIAAASATAGDAVGELWWPWTAALVRTCCIKRSNKAQAFQRPARCDAFSHPLDISGEIRLSALDMAPPAADVDLAIRPTETKVGVKGSISSRLTEPLRYSGSLEQYHCFDVTPAIGREFPQLQLSDIVNDDAKVRDLAITVSQRNVVFLRNQNISVEQQKVLGQKLGELTGKPDSSKLHRHALSNSKRGISVDEHGNLDDEISVISSEVSDDDLILGTYVTELTHDSKTAITTRTNSVTRIGASPAKGGMPISLLSVFRPIMLSSNSTLPEDGSGGDTLWASGYEAYDRLSPAWQQLAERLTGTHHQPNFNRIRKQFNDELFDGVRGSPENTGFDFSAEHPVVRTNPVTGWKSLFAAGHQLDHGAINGVTDRESEILKAYYTQLITENHDLQVRFRWNKNDVAIWDNRSTYHTATTDYNGKRQGNRVVSVGEKPYYDPKSTSRRDALGLA